MLVWASYSTDSRCPAVENYLQQMLCHFCQCPTRLSPSISFVLHTHSVRVSAAQGTAYIEPTLLVHHHARRETLLVPKERLLLLEESCRVLLGYNWNQSQFSRHLPMIMSRYIEVARRTVLLGCQISNRHTCDPKVMSRIQGAILDELYCPDKWADISVVILGFVWPTALI